VEPSHESHKFRREVGDVRLHAGALAFLFDNALDLATRLLAREGAPIALTTGEFSLLKVLVEHAREPMSRDKLMDLARGREHESYDRSIDVQVSRLRRLLGEDPHQPRFIQTLWGFGYVFVPDGLPAK